ncbi:MAG: hypothetical protein Q8S33_09795 [Myxococcales bacterium]|nr:hypothetical protein [Myxococcales bacterium]
MKSAAVNGAPSSVLTPAATPHNWASLRTATSSTRATVASPAPSDSPMSTTGASSPPLPPPPSVSNVARALRSDSPRGPRQPSSSGRCIARSRARLMPSPMTGRQEGRCMSQPRTNATTPITVNTATAPPAPPVLS